MATFQMTQLSARLGHSLKPDHNDDFQIRCGDSSWHVKKSIICPASKYFERLCRLEPWRATETFSYTRPGVMEATLGYIYSANYDPAISRSYCNISNLEFHVDVYKLACMLEIPELPDLAKSSCTAILGDEHFLYIAAIAVLDLVLSMHYDPNHDPWLRSAALKLAARCRACEDFHVLDSLLTVLDHSAWRKAKDHENFLAEMRLVERERLHEVGQLRREVERLNRELSENKNIPRNDRCTCPSRPIQVVSGPNGACQRLDDHTALVSSTSSTESADFETRPAEFLQLALPDTKQETRAMNKADPDKATFYSVAPGASTGTMRLQEVRQHEISGLQIAWR